MSRPSSDAPDFSDASHIIFVVLTPDSAIVTSRKRKLRELFAVATQTQPLPQQAHALSDAPAATTAEWQFLQTNDILQYVDPMHLIFFPVFFPCFDADWPFFLFWPRRRSAATAAVASTVNFWTVR